MTKTILVADDSKTIQNVVSLTFRATDFKVVAANDGDEALRRVTELRPDIVLADVAMPGRNGYDLCRDVKATASTAHIPVLLLAGAFEPFDDRKASDARADGHIKKPFDSQALIDRVTQLTGARAPEMPMSFAASLAARQKTEPPAVEARAGAGASAGPRSSPSNLAATAAPATNTTANAVQKSTSSPAMGARSIASDLGVPGAASAPMSWGASIPPPREPPPLTPAQQVQQAKPVSSPGLMIEEPEYIEDAEVVEDYEEAARAVPSLEPPRPPSAAEQAARAKVDVWALAEDDEATQRAQMNPLAARAGAQSSMRDEVREEIVTRVYADARANDTKTASYAPEGGDIEAIEEIEIDEIPPERRRASAMDAGAIAKAAAAAAPAVAAAASIVVPGMAHDELVRVAREVIERIAWEVVPELAETIIREELARLMGDRE